MFVFQMVMSVFRGVFCIVANVGSTSGGPNEVFPLACMMLTIAARFEAPRKNHQKVTAWFIPFLPGFFLVNWRHFQQNWQVPSFLLVQVFVVFVHWLYCITVSNLLKSYLGWDMMKQNESDTHRVQKWVKCSYHLSGVQCTVYSVRSRYHITDLT